MTKSDRVTSPSSGAGGTSSVRCAVVGASGYAGAELVSILAGHPGAALVSVHADGSAGRRWEDLHPGRAHLYRGELLAFDADALAGLDVVFLAQPHGESAKAAAALHGRVGLVVDLSGDLRLDDPVSYRRWYGIDHPAPELLGQAIYGLPEIFDGAPGGAPAAGAYAGKRLIACAGCYATLAQLAAFPALAGGLADGTDVVVSAVSGTTGAGRKADVATSFSEMTGNLRAYRVGRHQHVPEIAHGLGRAGAGPVRVTFVPHIAPIGRGIFATVVMRARAGIGQDELLGAYRRRYDGRPFVRIVDPRVRLPQVLDVCGTNFCDLAPVLDEEAGTIVVLGVLDNLVKGAAGQAVQVMNLALGLPETAGLLPALKEEACLA